MLTLPPAVRIYVATAPCDLRKQFDGLAALVAQGLQEDPRSGHLYVFCNQRGSHVRILFWDRSGYCLVSKRLGALREWGFADVAKLRVGEALLAATVTTDPSWRQGARKVKWRPLCCEHGGRTRSMV